MKRRLLVTLWGISLRVTTWLGRFALASTSPPPPA